jgi:hypothetical protein
MTEQQKEAVQKAQQAVLAALDAGVNPDKIVDSIIQTVIEVERTRPHGAADVLKSPQPTAPRLTGSIG